MIFHIFPYEKFTNDYIVRINKLFDSKEHIFFVYGNKHDSEIRSVKADNVIFDNQMSFVEKKRIINKYIKESQKVIIHSLFCGLKILVLLRIKQNKYGKKYFWNIWGADLYNAYWNRNKTIKNRIVEIFRKRFIRDLPAVGYIKGDYEFLVKNYNTNAKFFLASYTYDFYVPEVDKSKEDMESVNILLGNSATRECQYIEALDMLSEYKDRPIKIKCVLSYPDNCDAYRDEVVEYGRKIFGNKFEPLVDFMTYEKYLQLLSGIDIAIFNHNRQQALGNIAGLLYLGKRVYINPENACKQFFEDIGASVYSTRDLNSDAICKTDSDNLKIKNRKMIDLFFSDEQFAERWRRIFENNW